MKTIILDISVSASGSPSEVRARIADQAAASGGKSPEQASALAAIRTFIDKSVEGLSEDDTLAVSGTMSVSVTEAPAIVSQKITAAEQRAAASDRVTQQLRQELDAVKAGTTGA